jgi:hypothetical protein
MKAISLLLVALLCSIASPAFAVSNADGWITAPDAAPDTKPIVLHFRRVFSLAARPSRFIVRVTADNRFILYVNGKRIAFGPSTGDVDHWRVETINLAPHLRRGRNVVAALVWDGVKPLKLPPNATDKQKEAAEGAALFTNTAPLFQQNVATGFRLLGQGAAAEISTARPGWRVERDRGHSFENGWRQVKRWYYVAGNPETIDASATDFDWASPIEHGPGWANAIPAPDAAHRTLVADKLPPQTYERTEVGRVVRTDLASANAFPDSPVLIPANSKVTILIERPSMVAAFPELQVSGGKGASIRLTWAEALYDQKMRKGDRTVIDDRKPVGIWDTFTPDGRTETFSTLWWRTWRFAQIEVETKDQPLKLEAMRAYRTGYPFREVGKFDSNDPVLKRIFDVGWRTARLDAHETYMDTAYWEQLQYVGDTRLQALISYSVGGDPRLAEQAIDALADSDVDGGLMESAYPSRGSAVIPPFALLWVGMLDDWRMYQPDPKPVTRHLERMRRILAWFSKYQQPSGLLGKNPYWNFIDWVGQSATDRDVFPSYGKTNESCLLTVFWLGALEQGAAIERTYGDARMSDEDRNKANSLKSAIKNRCWVPARGLFADNPDGDRFSQHMNALAVLYDVVDRQSAQAILSKIVSPGHGIDAPTGITPVSYYFARYLAHALAHAGLGDRYVELLKTWRDLLALHYTTWPEERDTDKYSTRSDTHAWSAHPTADLIAIVAGIGPGSPGYSSVRIAPALGSIRKLSATAATPMGAVRVSYIRAAGRLQVTIDKPANLAGEFVWLSRRYPLNKVYTRLELVDPR